MLPKVIFLVPPPKGRLPQVDTSQAWKGTSGQTQGDGSRAGSLFPGCDTQPELQDRAACAGRGHCPLQCAAVPWGQLSRPRTPSMMPRLILFITKMLPVTFCTLHLLRFFVLLLIFKHQSRGPILIKCEFNKCLLGTNYFKVVPAWAQMTQHASELLSAWSFSQCSVGGRESSATKVGTDEGCLNVSGFVKDK